MGIAGMVACGVVVAIGVVIIGIAASLVSNKVRVALILIGAMLFLIDAVGIV